MHRREFLRTAAAGAAAVGLTGCLSGGDANPDVVLPAPDREVDSETLPYPAWGEALPDVALPAPLEDRTVDLRAVAGPKLLTFFYSHCKTVCPVLVSTLRSVQAHALSNGYGSAVNFFPVTFDPARDDADRLRTYADRMNVDADAGNWHFLRPSSPGRAEAVVEDQFGVTFRRDSMADGTSTTEDGETTTTGDGGTTTAENGETTTTGDGGYMFTHMALTLLVNGDDYVERAYRTTSPSADRLVDHLRTVRNA